MNRECLINVAEDISEELEGARNYMWKAIHFKDEHPEIAKMYSEMGGNEAEHAQKLFMIGKRMADISGDAEMVSMWELSKGMVSNGLMKYRMLQENYKS